MARAEIVKKAEKLVERTMKGNDASRDASHVCRVRDLALSLAHEEGLSSYPDSMEIGWEAWWGWLILALTGTQIPDLSINFNFRLWQLELAALLHDIGDYKYLRDPSEEKIVEKFLEEEGVDEIKEMKILAIIEGMGFKEELAGFSTAGFSPEFGVVQDADRLDAIGAVDLSKQYMKKEEQTTVNHFHEKLLKLKDLMKMEAGKKRAEKRHHFMEEFLKEFYEEWDGRA